MSSSSGSGAPWQVKDFLEELTTYFDRNPEEKPVAAFEASVIPTDVGHRWFESRPRGSFIVVKEYLYFLSPEQTEYGTDPSSKLVRVDIEAGFKAASFAWDIYNQDPEAIVRLLGGLAKGLADIITGKERERWLEAALKGPNSFIIPLRAIERVTPEPKSKNQSFLSDAAKLEITTPQRSYWLFEDEQSLRDRTRPPVEQGARWAYHFIKTAIFGWRPDLVKFLTETIHVPPTFPAQGVSAITKSAVHRRRRRKS